MPKHCFKLIFLILFIVSCVSKNRNVSSTAEKAGELPGYEYVYGLNNETKYDYWHLSQGTEFYPYAWMTRLTNLVSPNSKGKFEAFLQGLDHKYNVVPSDSNKYLIPWLGFSASWSGQNVNDDVYLNEKEEADLFKVIAGNKRSMAMVGLNCAACHSRSMRINGLDKIINGASAQLDVFNLLKDLTASTLRTMLEPNELAKFLKKFKGFENQSKQQLAEYSCNFSWKLKSDLGIRSVWALLLNKSQEEMKFNKLVKSCQEKINLKEAFTLNKEQAYLKVIDKIKRNKLLVNLRKNNRKILRDALAKLLKDTIYAGEKNVSLSVEEINHLDRISKLVSQAPFAKSVEPGPGRADAVGRIANGIVRTHDPVPILAPVANPSVWGMKYKSVFHFNGNTNSLLLRNIGQSFGLGATLVNTTLDDFSNDRKNIKSKKDFFKSTVNLKNLVQLENLMYQIKTPQWTQVVGTIGLDKSKIIPGCNLYVNHCMGCHSPSQMVGDSDALYNYNPFKLDHPMLGTDPNQTVLQSKKVDGLGLKEALFEGFVKKVRDSHQDDLKNLDSVNSYELKQLQRLRGVEEFRDTYVGESQASNNYMNADPGQGYVANHLSGIWATAPYLHNDSVVNMYELLREPSLRRKVFNSKTNKLDIQKLGLKIKISDKIFCKKNPKQCFSAIKENNSTKSFYKKMKQYRDGQRSLPDYTEIKGAGSSNLGHFDPSWNFSEDDTYSLIEFLKVLEPEKKHMWPEAERDYFYKIEKNRENNYQCVAGPNLSDR